MFALTQLHKSFPENTEFSTKPPGVYLPLTWCNGCIYRSALHIIFNSDNTDVVLHSGTEVVQRAGILACLHKLLHTLSLLSISGSAHYFVASDILGEECQRKKDKEVLMEMLQKFCDKFLR